MYPSTINNNGANNRSVDLQYTGFNDPQSSLKKQVLLTKMVENNDDKSQKNVKTVYELLDHGTNKNCALARI